jgi:hypothetical protein
MVDTSAMSENWRYERALGRIDDFRRELGRTPSENVDLVEQERAVQKLVQEVGLELMREVFQQADTKSPEVTINGKKWGNRRTSDGTYTTTFGELKLPRSTYSPSGGGKIAVAIDYRLGIVEGRYTPLVAKIICRCLASMPAEEAAALLKEVGVAAVSSSTLHRLPALLSARYEKNREAFDSAVMEHETVPEAAVTVQVGLDGVMIPQDGEDTNPRGRKTSSPKAPRHETRYGPVNVDGPAQHDGEVGRAWHEGSVGTLAFYDAQGEHIRTIYRSHMPEQYMATTSSDLKHELLSILRERTELDVCFASDGDLHQWKILEDLSEQLPSNHSGTTRFLLDFYHASEYLSDFAAKVHGEDNPERLVTSEKWRATLRELKDGADDVLKSMRYFRDQYEKGSKAYEALDSIIKYLAKNNRAGRLQYAKAKEEHKPIGTGVTEAAAKTVVNTRMKRAGARFDQHGGQTVLTFRAAILSARYDALFNCIETSYRGKVAEAA